MINLLLTAFSEYPNENTGGPNKVIHQIIKNLDYSEFSPTYLSKHLFCHYDTRRQLNNIFNTNLSFRKKIGISLYNSLKLYRYVVQNPFYLRIFFEKGNKFFLKKCPALSKYDIVHAHDIRSMYFLRDISARKKILTIHTKGPFIKDLMDYAGSSKILKESFKKYDLMENEAIRSADVVTFPSDSAKQLFISLKKNVNLYLDKIKVIYNGIDINGIKAVKAGPEFFEKYSFLTRAYDYKILNVADHIKVKNIHLLLEVINILKYSYNKRILLINIGSGPETKKLKKLSKKLQISKEVKFLGRQSNLETLKFLKSMDVVISLAERVVFDLILLEALASNIIVIATNIGGNKELITNGINGFLLEDLNPDRIAKFISKIDLNTKLNTIDTIKKYQISNIISGYEQLYRD